MNTFVLETTDHGDYPVDVYQKLSNDRILFLSNYIDDRTATDLVANLMLKDSESTEKITLFINCDGGDIRNALMIYDTMQIISAPVETVCIGAAMDEAALILAAGTPTKRFATVNSIISVGQLETNYMMYSDMTNAKTMLDQTMLDNKKMLEIIAKSCKKTYKQVSSDFDRKVFMNAVQAAKYNLIDKVIKFK